MSAPSPRFRTTRWSQVLAAGTGEPGGRVALEELCKAYWYPLYAFARRQGRDPQEAQDAVQGFFAELLTRRAIAKADPERGLFRSFLLGSFKHSMANAERRDRARKRGGGASVLSLDVDLGERQFALEPSHTSTPERAFERTWALALLREVLGAVRSSYVARGQAELFDALKEFLTAADGAQSYGSKAEALGMREGTVKVAVHRLRKRYGNALLEAVGDTLDGSRHGAEAELRCLLAALKPL